MLALSYWLNTSIVIFLMFFFGRLIAPWGAITPVGMQVLGIFLGLIWGWSIIEILWPSLMGMLALGMSDYMTMAQAMQEGFGNSCVLLVFFCLIFATYFDSTGINKIIAEWQVIWEKENPDGEIYNDYFCGFFKESYKQNPQYQRDGGDWINWQVPGTDYHVPFLQSGFGDGTYPVYWGFDENGKVCQLIVQFIDIELAYNDEYEEE